MINAATKKGTRPDDQEEDMADWIAICDAVDDGEYDEGLEEIARAIAGRRDVVLRRSARRAMRDLQKGDRVELTHGIKPRFWEGTIGTIVKLSGTGLAIVKVDSIPSHRGRPPAEGRQDRLEIPVMYLRKLVAGVKTLVETEPDVADIGDDQEEDDEELEDDEEE
jgi:hypothetical protein